MNNFTIKRRLTMNVYLLLISIFITLGQEGASEPGPQGVGGTGSNKGPTGGMGGSSPINSKSGKRMGPTSGGNNSTGGGKPSNHGNDSKNKNNQTEHQSKDNMTNVGNTMENMGATSPIGGMGGLSPMNSMGGMPVGPMGGGNNAMGGGQPSNLDNRGQAGNQNQDHMSNMGNSMGNINQIMTSMGAGLPWQQNYSNQGVQNCKNLGPVNLFGILTGCDYTKGLFTLIYTFLFCKLTC